MRAVVFDRYGPPEVLRLEKTGNVVLSRNGGPR